MELNTNKEKISSTSTGEPHLIGPRKKFPHGWTVITREDETQNPMHMDFSIVCFNKGETWKESHEKETAWVLMQGKATLSFDNGKTASVSRGSLFDEAPWVLHLGPKSEVSIQTTEDSEWALVRTRNNKTLPTCLYTPADIQTEHRGHDLVQGACSRYVRLAFDKTRSPDSNLVVGEVINQPGRWSSYPPHHHSQPEIYHYRFTEPQGYGHAEVGEKVYKVKNGDSIKITGGLDHAQVSAPGYGMYYLWFVRHLDKNPYLGFEFTAEHKWILDAKNQGWRPKDS